MNPYHEIEMHLLKALEILRSMPNYSTMSNGPMEKLNNLLKLDGDIDLIPSKPVPAGVNSIDHLNDIANIDNSNDKLNNNFNDKLNDNELNDELVLPEVNFVRQNIQLSFVYSSRNFFVQLDYNGLEQFNQKMTDFYQNVDKSLITIESSDIVVNKNYALFNVDDEGFYRIRILKIIDDTSVKAIYIDYGETIEVLKCNIFKLVTEFKKVPIFALECFINDQWTSNFQLWDTALWNFINLESFPYENLQACFEGKIGNRFIINQLFFDYEGKNHKFFDYSFDLNTEFFQNIHFNLKTFLPNVTYKQNLIENAYQKLAKFYPNVNVNNIINGSMMKLFDISSFLVKSNDLENFVSNFSFFYNTYDNVINCQPNDLIVIYYQNYYLRVFVLEQNESGFELLAIDLGGIITLKEIVPYRLSEIFSMEKFPPFTILCAMNRLIPNGKNTWNLMATVQFKKLTAFDSFKVNIVTPDLEKCQVEIVAGGVDVSQKLKIARIAKEK